MSNLSVFIALDRSGSMSGEKWTGAITSINEYVAGLQKEKVEGDLTLVAFDTDMGGNVRLITMLDKVSIPYYTPLIASTTIQPSGMTPLYDAAARVMDLALERNNERAIVVIVTDGMENASREYTQPRIKSRVEHITSRGWEVLFLGANFDVTSYTAGAGLDLSKMRNFDLTSAASRSATATMMAFSTMNYAKTGTAINLGETV